MTRPNRQAASGGDQPFLQRPEKPIIQATFKADGICDGLAMLVSKPFQRFSAALLTAAALAAGGAAASAQESEGAVRLSGSVQLGPELPGVSIVDATSLGARTPAPERQSSSPITEPDTGSASALPWYERFTVAPSESYAVWGGAPREFQLEAGERWGVTLGYSEGGRSVQDFSLDDFSAGAFFEFSERVRVGGELRFTSPEEEIFGEESERKTPELRFESAFRF